MIRIVFQVNCELIPPPMNLNVSDPLMILQSLSNARFTPPLPIPTAGHIHPKLSTQMFHTNSQELRILYRRHRTVSWIEHPA
jgi:hypothetical protein